MKNIFIVVGISLLAAIGGFMLHNYLNEQRDLDNPIIGHQRPDFSAKDLKGKMRHVKEWDGKILLINFWATWCAPCKKEIPGFIKLQEKYGTQGFQIIGIALDDEESVKEFAQEIKINYPIMAVEGDGALLSTRYGNSHSILPYSVLINRKGEISSTITGELDMIQAKKLLEKLGIKL